MYYPSTSVKSGRIAKGRCGLCRRKKKKKRAEVPILFWSNELSQSSGERKTRPQPTPLRNKLVCHRDRGGILEPRCSVQSRRAVGERLIKRKPTPSMWAGRFAPRRAKRHFQKKSCTAWGLRSKRALGTGTQGSLRGHCYAALWIALVPRREGLIDQGCVRLTRSPLDCMYILYPYTVDRCVIVGKFLKN